MSTVATHYFQLDSLALNTNSHMLDGVDGIDGVPAKRQILHRAAYVDGGTDDASIQRFVEPRVIGLEVIVTPYDANGAVTHAGGIYSEHQQNIDDLLKVVGKNGRIDVRRIVANPDSTGTITLQAYARRAAAQTMRGSPLLKRMRVELELPYPYFHIGTSATTVALPAATSTPISLGGTAPVADMVFDFTAAGTITYDEGTTETIQITSFPATGPVRVDVGARTCIDVATGTDWRPYLRVGQPWWMRWPAASTVTLTTSGGAVGSVDYFTARH